ncbi:hypothetical protein F442_14169, partial [Phytophthora nicotianae P10297]
MMTQDPLNMKRMAGPRGREKLGSTLSGAPEQEKCKHMAL